MNSIYKYPRTHHIEGSRLQPGDEDMQAVSWDAIQKKYPNATVVVEEKMDGANAGISCSNNELQLQSRGHYLTGGAREKHFDLFKQWAFQYQQPLCSALGNNLVLYGEWLYAKHTIFYDQLPHYFLEFDILDTTQDFFWSTARRKAFLSEHLPMVTSVAVLYEGEYPTLTELQHMVNSSLFISSGHILLLQKITQQRGLDVDTVLQETDKSRTMEGLYIKIEDDEKVLARYKYIRHDFLLTVIESQTHWLNRPIIPNQLKI